MARPLMTLMMASHPMATVSGGAKSPALLALRDIFPTGSSARQVYQIPDRRGFLTPPIKGWQGLETLCTCLLISPG
ncbi:MAG: hypothetical protein AB1611_20610 [bacterium]